MSEFKVVPVEFVRRILTLAHNWSLTAIPPDYYDGRVGDAFKEAYRRCGADMAEAKTMLAPEDHGLVAVSAKELAELRADAARYAHLKSLIQTYSLKMDGQHSYVASNRLGHLRGPSLSAAIDQALSESGRVP